MPLVIKTSYFRLKFKFGCYRNKRNEPYLVDAWSLHKY